MAINTTAVACSTTPVEVFSSATTWANTAGASLYDTVPFVMFNASTHAIRVIGSNSTGAVATGLPVASSAYFETNMMKGDAIFVATTASTGTVNLFAGRQVGGVG